MVRELHGDLSIGHGPELQELQKAIANNPSALSRELREGLRRASGEKHIGGPETSFKSEFII